MNSKPDYLKFQKAAIRKNTPLHIWNPQEKIVPPKKKGQKKHSKKELFSELEDDEDPLSVYDSNSIEEDCEDE